MPIRPLPPKMLDEIWSLAKKIDANVEAAFKRFLAPEVGFFAEDLKAALRSCEVDDADRLANQLMKFAGYFYNDDSKSGTPLERFDASIDSETEETKEIEHNGRSIVRFASSHKLNNAYKVVELSYQREHLLKHSKVIVDARPIYDSSRTELIAFSVLSQLEVNFSEGSLSKFTSIALDRADIEKLRDNCIQALNKMDTLSEQLAKQLRIPVYQPGVQPTDE